MHCSGGREARGTGARRCPEVGNDAGGGPHGPVGPTADRRRLVGGLVELGWEALGPDLFWAATEN
jgi:hypothetical protein